MEIKGISSIRGWAGKYRQNITVGRVLSVLSMDILVRLSNVILLPVYLRLMTQEDYGIYNYILTVISSFALILNFGLFTSQSKYYADAHSERDKKIVFFNIFILLSILLTLIIIPVYAFKLDYSLISLLFKNNIHYTEFRWAMLLALIVSVYTVILTNFFITTEKIKTYRKYNTWRLIVVNVIVLVCLYYFKSDKVHVRLLYTYICELLVLLFFFTLYAKQMLPLVDKKRMVNFLKIGFPLMLSSVWGLFSNYGDKFFLEKYGTTTDLSYYYLAFSLGNILYMICVAAQNVWMPVFLKEKDLKVNVAKTNRLLKKLVIVLLILSVFLMVGLFVAIKIKIISDKYTPALYILPFILPAQIIMGVVLIYSNYMVYFEKTHWALFTGIITSAVSLAGSYFCVRFWGVFGAAIVYLLVQAAYLYIYYLLVRYKIKKLEVVHQ